MGDLWILGLLTGKLRQNYVIGKQPARYGVISSKVFNKEIEILFLLKKIHRHFRLIFIVNDYHAKTCTRGELGFLQL